MSYNSRSNPWLQNTLPSNQFWLRWTLSCLLPLELLIKGNKCTGKLLHDSIFRSSVDSCGTMYGLLAQGGQQLFILFWRTRLYNCGNSYVHWLYFLVMNCNFYTWHCWLWRPLYSLSQISFNIVNFVISILLWMSPQIHFHVFILQISSLLLI